MIFPNLKDKIFGYVNLDLESREWYKNNNIDLNSKNKLLDPDVCQVFVDSVHKKYSLDFSYGGWMEDRTFFLREGYWERENNFIHLGVDINVPTGTEIATDFKAEVVRIGDDNDPNGGWGPHVILKHLDKNIYIIYSHLDKNILCKIGDKLEKDTIFAKVGSAPSNGGWFPHVHVQAIDYNYYPYVEKNWEKFDGYGFKNEIELNAKKHVDPMEFIYLK